MQLSVTSAYMQFPLLYITMYRCIFSYGRDTQTLDISLEGEGECIVRLQIFFILHFSFYQCTFALLCIGEPQHKMTPPHCKGQMHIDG